MSLCGVSGPHKPSESDWSIALVGFGGWKGVRLNPQVSLPVEFFLQEWNPCG